MPKEGLELVGQILSLANKSKAKRIMIHLPAGLSHLAKELEEKRPKGKEFLFWSDGCYGACDIPHLQAKFFKCQLVISVGHSPMRHWNKLAVPVVFAEYFKGHPSDLKLPEIPGKKIAIVASNQFLHLIPEAKSQLKKAGKIPLVGKSGVMCSVDGQVTGCEFVSALQFKKKADSILILGEGNFHSSGLVESCELPCYQLDPAEGILRKLEPKGPGKKINFLYAKNLFGLLVSAKPGQEHLSVALGIKARLEAIGKRAIVLAADTFSPSIRNFSEIEVLVTCACPRLSDDWELYEIPVLSAEEVLRELSKIEAFSGKKDSGKPKKDKFFSQ